MTLKEAYSFLARRQMHFEDNPDLYKKELIESHNIAVDCVAKQILKKPKWDSRMPKCLTCHNWINDNETIQKYCNYCGQAIDWSDK